MGKIISAFCIFFFFFHPKSESQNIEIDGTAKVNVANQASQSAQPLGRELDGTLVVINSTTSYSVGDFVHGGVVFWVNSNGNHGKVVSIYDIKSVNYSNVNSVIIGASAQSEINGAGNSVAIIQQSGHERSAANLCSAFEYSKCSDWYLPSKNELNLLYTNKIPVDSSSTANGGEMLIGSYWSSTEHPLGSAWWQHFSDGFQNHTNKASTNHVRPIRAF